MRASLAIFGAAALAVVAACSPNSAPSADGGPSSATIQSPPVEPAPIASSPATDAIAELPPVTGIPSVTHGGTATTTATSAPTTQPTTTAPPPVVGDPVVTTELVGSFDQPVDLAVRPGDEALWVVEQSGRVRRVATDGSASVALDVAGRISTRNEQGLLGLAFSPDGALAYVNRTDSNGATVITEHAVGSDGAFGDERVVITVDQPFSNHNAGDLAFGPDGMLYIPLGDGGSGGDPERHGSRPTTLLGSILRIDPALGPNGSYTIPADNPFAAGPFDGVEGAPEVWSWGLRNPWKIAFDPVSGDLWIADVGQNQFEEVNVVRPVEGTVAGRGVDFGWSAFEGTERFDDGVADSGRATPPVLTYDHGDGCSISGGVPYRGTAIAELEPAYVYSDFCNGDIWALDFAGGRNLTLVTGRSEVTAVRAGPDGELYVLERSGDVLQLIPG